MLTCSACGQEKPDEEFASASRNPKRRFRQYNCRTCANGSALENYHEKRDYYYEKARQRDREMRDRMSELKSAPCADCGQSYPPYVMDWDHVRGDKVQKLSTMMRRHMAWSKIAAEIAKCELVCANCHRIRTHQRLAAAGLDDPQEVA